VLVETAGRERASVKDPVAVEDERVCAMDGAHVVLVALSLASPAGRRAACFHTQEAQPTYGRVSETSRAASTMLADQVLVWLGVQ
jgi:hypothetical protein